MVFTLMVFTFILKALPEETAEEFESFELVAVWEIVIKVSLANSGFSKSHQDVEIFTFGLLVTEFAVKVGAHQELVGEAWLF